MHVPMRKIGPWARELIDECYVSRDLRIEQNRVYRNYYQSGSETGEQVRYNRCFGHVDRLSSMLFSPVDVRFDIELDQSEDAQQIAITEGGTRYLNREYARTGCDVDFSSGVECALIKGAALIKTVWGHNGLEPWVVHPEYFGVLREDIGDLDRQEAFVHSTWFTKSAFMRYIAENPDRAEILKEVEGTFKPRGDGDFNDSYFHEVLIGQINPVQSTSTGQGSVSIASNVPMLAKDIAAEMVRVDELWVLDDKRQDWTTIRIAGEDTVIEGRNRHRNLLADGDMQEHPFLRGEQPFRKICPNEVNGYFWGQSEIAQIARLQDLLTQTVNDVNRMVMLSADPPRAGIGFSGMTQEKYRALRRRGGFISEDSPNAKLETLKPEIPAEMFGWVDRILAMFDDVAGFSPVLMGQGEAGVRSQTHAQTLSRNSTPRLRDRALLTEKQAVQHGELCLKILQSKEAQMFTAEVDEKKISFKLGDLPDDYRVSIDSHTASPAFAEDNERKAFALHRAGAIDAVDLIMLTHPPHEDSLMLRARKRAAAQAKLIQEHPELLTKGKGRKM